MSAPQTITQKIVALPVGSAITLLFVIERVVFGSQHTRPIVRFDEHHEEPAEGGA